MSMFDWFNAAKNGYAGELKKYYANNPEMEVNAVNAKKETALLIACQYNHLSVVKYLHEELKADIELPDQWGNTPLMWACSVHAIETVEYLIKIGANIEAKNDREETPIIKGATNIKTVQLLVKAGADIKHKDKYGFSAIHSAIFVEVVQYLVEHGANINDITSDKFSVLLIACEAGNVEIAKYAVKVGADINIQDGFDYFTPLMYAVRGSTRRYEESYQIIQFLLLCGADYTIKDKQGETVLDYANKKDDKKGKIRDLLISWINGEDEI